MTIVVKIVDSTEIRLLLLGAPDVLRPGESEAVVVVRAGGALVGQGLVQHYLLTHSY